MSHLLDRLTFFRQKKEGFSDGNGILIKEIASDSFGNTTRDTLPQFFFPLGFAGASSTRIPASSASASVITTR